MADSKTDKVFRFAPSPNGNLHLGHAYSALLNKKIASQCGGKLLLRIEDIDLIRCTPELEKQMLEDLEWIGFEWDDAPRRQSEHFDFYRGAIDTLFSLGLVYPATMSRGELRKHIATKDWPSDPDGSPIYPGQERDLGMTEREAILTGAKPFSLRLDMATAVSQLSQTLHWKENSSERAKSVKANPMIWGDVVLARKDTPASYHLCCVLDDALQGVTNVVRGQDLFESTSVHRLLQELLGLSEPTYHHHALVMDKGGKKLSKSDNSTSIRALRKKGLSADDVINLLPEF